MAEAVGTGGGEGQRNAVQLRLGDAADAKPEFARRDFRPEPDGGDRFVEDSRITDVQLGAIDFVAHLAQQEALVLRTRIEPLRFRRKRRVRFGGGIGRIAHGERGTAVGGAQ